MKLRVTLKNRQGETLYVKDFKGLSLESPKVQKWISLCGENHDFDLIQTVETH